MVENSIISFIDQKEIIGVQLEVLALAGIIKSRIKYKSEICRLLQLLYFIIFTVLYFATEIAAIIVVFGDLEKMAQASFLFLTHLIETFKLIGIGLNYELLSSLLERINSKEFQPKTEEQSRLLESVILTSKSITIIFITMGIITCSMWGIFPFVDPGRTEIELPLSGWFPFDTSYSPVFEIVYAYQIIGALTNAIINISLDAFMASLLMFLSAQCSILSNSLMNVEKICKVRNNAKTDKTFKQELNDSFKICVQHHKLILKFAEDFTKIFTWVIMAQFVVSVYTICISGFKLTLVKLGSVEAISMVIYLCCMLMEIFLWCYYGNDVILNSSELTTAAYQSGWVNFPHEFKRDLLFFMTRSQFSLKLYAGGFFTLSLPTFLNILKSSWSYFAVLNHVHSQ